MDDFKIDTFVRIKDWEQLLEEGAVVDLEYSGTLRKNGGSFDLGGRLCGKTGYVVDCSDRYIGVAIAGEGEVYWVPRWVLETSERSEAKVTAEAKVTVEAEKTERYTVIIHDADSHQYIVNISAEQKRLLDFFEMNFGTMFWFEEIGNEMITL